MTSAEIDLIAAAVEKRVVDALEPRFEAIDRRFEAIDRRFEAIDRRLDQLTDLLQAFITGTAARFDALERKIDGEPPLTLVP